MLNIITSGNVEKLLKLAVLKCVYAFIHILQKQLIVKLSIRSSTSNAETKTLELAVLWSVDIKALSYNQVQCLAGSIGEAEPIICYRTDW